MCFREQKGAAKSKLMNSDALQFIRRTHLSEISGCYSSNHHELCNSEAARKKPVFAGSCEEENIIFSEYTCNASEEAYLVLFGAFVPGASASQNIKNLWRRRVP